MIATTFALSAMTLMSGCSSSDGDGSPPGGAGADPISIVTVTGAQHVLTGVHATACYGDNGSGRIDVLTITGAELTNESNIYEDDTCSSSILQTGKIIANMAGASDILISGWTGQGGIVPQRADGTGSLSENETVTSFDIEVTAVIDQNQIFGGNVSIGFKATAFYVFDDTAGGDTYIMYRDDDGAFASASDPYVKGTADTGSSLNFPILAISGNQFELAPVNGSTLWASGCYIGGTGFDSEQSIEVTGTSPVTLQVAGQNYVTNNGTCSDPGELEPFSITYEITLDGTTEVIAGWSDSDGSVLAPEKQDGTGSLTDTESYSNMTGTVTGFSINLAGAIAIGDVSPFAYIVDDSAFAAVLYSTKDDGTGDITVPLFLQLP